MPFDFIADHSTASIAIGLIGLVASVGYIVKTVMGKVPEAAPKAATKPKAPQTLSGIPTALPVAPELAKAAGNRPVAKLPSKNDQNQVPTEQVPAVKAGPVLSEAQRKAERMAELGFHHSVAKDVAESKSPSPVKVEFTAPKTEPETVTIAAAAAPVAKSQTAELDDILSRIDKVLAENPVMASNTLGSSADAGQATQSVNWMDEAEGGKPAKS